MTILSANLGRGYLVRREGSEDRGWIPSYTLHFQSVADHHHRPVNPAFSPWFKVNPANRSSQRGRSAGGGAASTKSPKTNAAEKKEGSANDKAVKQSTVLSRSEPHVLESTKYVSAVTTPPRSLKASACKNGTTMDSKVTGFKATDSSLSSPSLLKQLSSPSPTFRSSYTLTIKPR